MLEVYPGHSWTQERKQWWFGENPPSTDYEQYQRLLVEQETQTECSKPSPAVRLLIVPVCLYDEHVHLVRQRHLGNINHHTENFDGQQCFDAGVVYVNFKFIVGQGGNQTSRLKDVGTFIKAQMKWLDTVENDGCTYFANILDGERCAKEYESFLNVLTLDGITESYAQRIYVGDIRNYSSWLATRALFIT